MSHGKLWRQVWDNTKKWEPKLRTKFSPDQLLYLSEEKEIVRVRAKQTIAAGSLLGFYPGDISPWESKDSSELDEQEQENKEELEGNGKEYFKPSTMYDIEVRTNQIDENGVKKYLNTAILTTDSERKQILCQICEPSPGQAANSIFVMLDTTFLIAVVTMAQIEKGEEVLLHYGQGYSRNYKYSPWVMVWRDRTKRNHLIKMKTFPVYSGCIEEDQDGNAEFRFDIENIRNKYDALFTRVFHIPKLRNWSREAKKKKEEPQTTSASKVEGQILLKRFRKYFLEE